MTRLAFESVLYKFLKKDMSLHKLVDLGLHDESCGRQFCAISLKKPNQPEVWRALNGAVSLMADFGKIIVAVDEDIDPRDADAILSLGCGEGVQVIAEVFSDKRVYPANDTKFIGSQDRELDKFSELCSACGECILDKTAGICPITRCAKGLLNGPCGGQLQGKCEVDKENDCAWILIWKRLKERGEMDLFNEVWMPRDRRKSSSPRKIGGVV